MRVQVAEGLSKYEPPPNRALNLRGSDGLDIEQVRCSSHLPQEPSVRASRGRLVPISAHEEPGVALGLRPHFKEGARSVARSDEPANQPTISRKVG